MRKIIIEQNIYKYEELSERAKENVRRWIAENYNFDSDELINSINAICKNTGLKTGRTYSDIRHDFENLKGIRAYKFIYNNFIYPCRRAKCLNYDKKIYSKIHWEYDCNFTGVCYDYILWNTWEKWKKDFQNQNYYCIDYFCYLMGKEIEKEFSSIEEWVNSDKYAKEECSTNDYEFYEDGLIYQN